MRKRTLNSNPPPSDDEAFEKVEEPIDESQPSSFKKVRLPISETGVDWSAIPEEQKPAILAALASDENVLTQMASFAADGEEGDAVEPEGPKKYLREEHAHTFLTILSGLEKKFLPPVIRQILKRPMAPEVIQEAFQFSEKQEQNITPELLEMGEELIPEKYKAIIAYGSDKYKAIGLIAWAMKEQIENAVKMQLDYEKIHPPQTEDDSQGPKPEEQGKVM